MNNYTTWLQPTHQKVSKIWTLYFGAVLGAIIIGWVLDRNSKVNGLRILIKVVE